MLSKKRLALKARKRQRCVAEPNQTSRFDHAIREHLFCRAFSAKRLLRSTKGYVPRPRDYKYFTASDFAHLPL